MTRGAQEQRPLPPRRDSLAEALRYINEQCEYAERALREAEEQIGAADHSYRVEPLIQARTTAYSPLESVAVREPQTWLEEKFESSKDNNQVRAFVPRRHSLKYYKDHIIEYEAELHEPYSDLVKAFAFAKLETAPLGGHAQSAVLVESLLNDGRRSPCLVWMGMVSVLIWLWIWAGSRGLLGGFYESKVVPKEDTRSSEGSMKSSKGQGVPQ